MSPNGDRSTCCRLLACGALLGALAGLARADDAPSTQPAPPAGARVTDDGWFAPLQARTPAPKLPEKISRAFVIPIHGGIDDTLLEVVRRKAAQCRGKGAQLVIFDLDTPGGVSTAMNQLVRLILDDLRDAYTVAYVNPQAFSAGAVIALACNEIVLCPTGKMGAAMPIQIGPGGIVEIPEKERGKFESADRTGMRTLATHRGYDPLLCEAMVTIDMVVWLVRNEQTGELRFVEPAEGALQVRGAPDRTPTTAPASSPWQFVRLIDGPMELISMTADEAVFMGFCRHVAPSMADVEEYYHLDAPAVVLSDTWSEKLVAFLTSPAVAGLLLMLGILGIYLELQTPGFGVPGVLGVVCFAILFGSQYLIGLANWWEIALFVVGLVLIALEVFVIPGFGVAGVAGILCCVVGLLAMLIPNAPGEWPLPRTDLAWDLFQTGLLWLACAVVAAGAAIAVASKYLPKIPGANRLVLAPAEAADGAPVSDQSPMKRLRPGDAGVVESLCRPVGKARFGNDLMDVVCEGGTLAPGTRVRVLRRDGNRVVVEKAQG